MSCHLVGRRGPVGLFVSKLTTAPRDPGSIPGGEFFKAPSMIVYLRKFDLVYFGADSITLK